MKQTAVEWFLENLRNLIKESELTDMKPSEFDAREMELFKQAKEMEKQQRNHFEDFSKWIIENKRSAFEDADISIESKRKILNELGYSSGDY